MIYLSVFCVLSAGPVSEKYVFYIENLEILAQQIDNATRDGSFTVEINGRVYEPREGSLEQRGDLTCAEGQTSINGFCGNVVSSLLYYPGTLRYISFQG